MAILFTSAATSLAAGGRGNRALLVAGSDEYLDSRLRTTLIDQPRWLREAGEKGAAKARAARLFLVGTSRPAAPVDSVDARRLASDLRVRELSFPTRRVAVERSLTGAVFFNLSFGLDRELERGGIGDGEITPSFGLQIERRFQ